MDKKQLIEICAELIMEVEGLEDKEYLLSILERKTLEELEEEYKFYDYLSYK